MLEAAVRLYAREGWAAFTFEAVAREANVGKPAIYRRWESREELLGNALVLLSWPVPCDMGSMSADLRNWAAGMLVWWSSPAGSAYMRWLVDLRYRRDLGENYDDDVVTRIGALRGVLRRAIDRGELSPCGVPELGHSH